MLSPGQGSFGVVTLSRVAGARDRRRRRTHERVLAVKIQKKTCLSEVDGKLNKVLAERKILHRLPWNPFITALLDTFQDQPNVYFALEYMPNGNLLQEQVRRGGGIFEVSDAKFCFSNIVLGLEFLHKHGIVHCDLKLLNILVGEDGYLSIADFGMAKDLAWERPWGDTFGTLQYMPPESFDKRFEARDLNDDNAMKAVDWWSAGCVLFELLFGRLVSIILSP